MILKAWSVRQHRLGLSNTRLPTPAFIATLQTQAAKQDVANQAKVSDTPVGTTAAQYTLASQPILTDFTPGDNGSLEALTPNMLAEGIPIDWSEWDYLFQDFELQNASFAQT